MKRRQLLLGVVGGCAILAAMMTAYAGNPGAGGDTTADIALGASNFTGGRRSNPRQLLAAAVAIDRSVNPNRLYIADAGNNRVLGFSDVAALTNGQPADLVIGQPDFTSVVPNNGGIGASSLNNPQGVAVDSAGNLYVADTINNRVLEYPTPFSSGTGAAMVFGQPDFTSNIRSATSTGLALPQGLALDSHDNLFVADTGNDRVIEYNTPATTGDATADAVFGQHNAFNLIGCNNGGLSASTLCKPVAVAADAAGNLYVADQGNNRVLEFDNPLASDTTADMVFGQGGSFTVANITLPTADTLGNPFGVAVDGSGNLYIGDAGYNRVLEFDAPAVSRNTSAARVFGQSGSFTSDDSSLISATSMSSPEGVALDSNGHLYVADTDNDRVLEFDTPLSGATANLVLGQTQFEAGTALLDASTMVLPTGVAIDTSVTPSRLYVADFAANRVLGYRSVNALSSGAPADIVIGQADLFTSAPNTGGIGAGTLNGPSGIAVDGGGNLYVADTGNSRVLEYDTPFASDAIADMVFGTNGSFTAAGDASNPRATSLAHPSAVAVDANGTVYIADQGNNRVLGYPDPVENGTTASIVLGQSDFTSNSIHPPSAATLAAPQGVAIDPGGNLYVADTQNDRVMIFSAPVTSQQSGTPVMGTLNSLDVGGPLQNPSAVAIGPGGAVYVLDRDDNRVLGYSGPTVNTPGEVFGQSNSLVSVLCNESGADTTPNADTLCESPPGGFTSPPVFAAGLGFDSAGNAYIADTLNARVLEYFQPPAPSVPAVAMVPGAIDFGNVELTTGASRDEGVYNNQSVPITANFSINGPADFFLQSPSCSAASDAQCSGTVFFVPSKTGPQNAQLIVTLSGPGGGPFAIPLSGNGVVPTPTPTATATPTATPSPTAVPTPVAARLTALPLNLSFGNQPFAVSGNASSPKRITLINRGRVAVSLAAPAIAGNNPADFQITAGGAAVDAAAVAPACGASLDPGHRCIVFLRFRPTSLGPRSAALMLGSNALKGAHAVSLNGQGVPPRLLISPGTVAFGTQAANTTSAPMQVVLNNRSPVPIEIQSISVDTTQFAADQSCLGNLAPNSQCSIAVTFTPAAAGRVGGFLSIGDNAAGFVQRVRLSGTGE